MSQGKNLQLEICMPINFSLLMEASGNKVSGVFDKYVTPYFDMIEEAFNATISIQDDHPGLGDRIRDSNSYDGCLGKLQRGEANFIAQAGLSSSHRNAVKS